MRIDVSDLRPYETVKFSGMTSSKFDDAELVIKKQLKHVKKNKNFKIPDKLANFSGFNCYKWIIRATKIS